MINPDMTPLKEQFAVCAWIKRRGPTRRWGTWLTYRTKEKRKQRIEMKLTDMFLLTYLLNDRIPYQNRVVPAHSEWYHVCFTFSHRNKAKSAYYNGERVETQTVSRKLSITAGSLVIGQFHSTYKMEAFFMPGNQFGGEIAKLNIFSRSLTDKEVADMYSSGICSNYEESLIEDTFLSWNTLLGDETEKHGNISRVNLTCSVHSQGPTTLQPTGETENKSNTPNHIEETGNKSTTLTEDTKYNGQNNSRAYSTFLYLLIIFYCIEVPQLMILIDTYDHGPGRAA
jgi:hypothetical protein